MIVNSSHNNLWLRDRIRYGFMRKNFTTIDVDLILNDDVLAQNCHIFQSHLEEKFKIYQNMHTWKAKNRINQLPIVRRRISIQQCKNLAMNEI